MQAQLLAAAEGLERGLLEAAAQEEALVAEAGKWQQRAERAEARAEELLQEGAEMLCLIGPS